MKKPTHTKPRSLTLTLAAFCAITLLAACAQAAKKPKFDPAPYKNVAIIVEDFDYSYGNSKPAIKTSIETAMQQQLIDRSYSVVDRSAVEKILKELDFQGSLSDQQITALRTKIKCTGLFILTPTSLKEGFENNKHTYEITIAGKLIDVNTLGVVWSAMATYPKNWLTKATAMAQNMSEAAGKCISNPGALASDIPKQP